MRLVFFLLMTCSVITTRAQSKLSVIPVPEVLKEKPGSFKPDKKTLIVYNSDQAAMLATYTQQLVAEANGSRPGLLLQEGSVPKKNTITLLLDSNSVKHKEGYLLDVTAAGIVIKAGTANGLFYGLQTLIQLIPLNDNKAIPAVHIEDKPRFSWRGMLFDNCRHMFSVDFIKRFIDQLAYHKLNKFHWPLTEDQGWRIEVKKYPRLQEVAAWRNGTQVGPSRKKDVDSTRYGGYYTQEQVKDIVAYAASRYVEVIPEIEMPGHSVAAITAYPYLGCTPASFETGRPHEVRKAWGVSKDLYCAGNDSVFTFLQDVLTEVMQLFPSQYIHIGGDEAPHDAWKVCPKCQKRMKDENLATVEALQSWFIRRMEKFINGSGKKLIGWEEIMQGGLTKNATVHSWLGVKSGLRASQMGNDVIMSPYSHLYFDGYQADPSIEPFAIGYYVPIDSVYAFEPVHPTMTAEEAKHVLGAQANLWTEFIGTNDYFEYMVFPRMDALAEMTWSPREKRNFPDFEQRLQTQLQRYDLQKINYRIPTPGIRATYAADSTVHVVLLNRKGPGVIRYEINNEVLTPASPVYRNELILKQDDILRFASFPGNGRQSSVDFFPRKKGSKK